MIKKILIFIFLLMVVFVATMLTLSPLDEKKEIVLLGQHPALKPKIDVRRYVVFGDSLSDTGNYPEPTNVEAPRFSNFNLYIPVSNPVPENLYGKNGFPSKEFLQRSVKYQGKINGQPKSYYSMNWPLYFTYGKQNHQLVSWYAHTKDSNSTVHSINYAWASAVSGKESSDGKTQTGLCFHDDGSEIGVCSKTSILKGRAAYALHTQDLHYDQEHGYDYQDMVIPDVGKQVELYIEDTRPLIRKNTSFIIYIGANDISRYLRAHIVRVMFGAYHSDVKSMTKGIVSNVEQAVQKLKAAYPSSNQGNHIYILTLPNFDYLHVIHDFSLVPNAAAALTYAVQQYNAELGIAFKDNPDVSVIDSGTFIDALAHKSIYAASAKSGSTCIGSDDDLREAYVTPLAVISNTNCGYVNKNGEEVSYFGWNNAHFTSSVNKDIADFLRPNIK
ncbi:SGNH/GDSL hydrolase family protein [Francisellaceae bacterium]|nr:SGNH/GDSL hydrolase family protein [Francisellaceae bacterium]